MPFSPAAGTDSQAAIPAIPSAADDVPQLLPGVELVGEYQGSGLAQTTYLVKKPGGQAIQVSRLLYLVLEGIDGIRTLDEVAGMSAPPSTGP